MPHIKPETMELMRSGDIISVIKSYQVSFSKETYRQIIEEYRAELTRRNDLVSAGGVQ